MLPSQTFQPNRRFHRRNPTAQAADAPPPAVVTVSVETAGGGRFGWFFDRTFDDSGSGSWVAADFAALTIDGVAPSGIDEVIGGEGNLTLVYPFATATAFAVLGVPAKLHFDVGPATIVPASGPVV